MTRGTLSLVAALAAASLSGCGAPARPEKPADSSQPPADAGYVNAPAVLAAAPVKDHVRLEGLAVPGSEVQLLTPAGERRVVAADIEGRWRMDLPSAPEARVFGLSNVVGGRRVQAQGYVLVTETGVATLLRAGVGSVVLLATDATRLLSVDFDRQGGAVVSGAAPPDGSVSVRIDGRPGPVGRADGAGRFHLSLVQPLTAGRHQVRILGDNFDLDATIDATPGGELGGAPFRTLRTPDGLRVDWLTPGGGLQSTWILN